MMDAGGLGPANGQWVRTRNKHDQATFLRERALDEQRRQQHDAWISSLVDRVVRLFRRRRS